MQRIMPIIAAIFAFLIVAESGLAQSGRFVQKENAKPDDHAFEKLLPAQQSRITERELADCMTKNNTQQVLAILDLPLGYAEIEQFSRDFLSIAEKRECVTNYSIRGSVLVFRGSVFDSLYRSRFFGKLVVADSLKNATGSWIRLSNGGTQDIVVKQYLALMALGECIVRTSPDQAVYLIETKIESAIESAAFDAIAPVISGCVPQGQSLRLNRSLVRGAIAEPLYRMRAML